ncbi:MAG: arabinan endo-1,5-alpha-L-arabinosidase [Planctomycetaceae bacterium]|nr:arabinan endo-1,5-alpha-L-arabinosidase [Planctomycetaceae bacterium]
MTSKKLFIFVFLLITSAFSQEPKLSLIPFDTPDPTALIADDGSGIYVFTTAAGIRITRSKNLIDWEHAGQVFDTKVPQWAAEVVPGAKGIWAPDIVRVNGLYYLYYSVSTFGGQHSVIGLAVNKTLNPKSAAYKWEDRGIVLGSAPGKTDYNAIDSALFVDDDGKAYLFWGSYWSGIKAVEVDSKTGKPFKYSDQALKIPADYISAATRKRSDDTSIEAPFVIKHDGNYYLFTSRGSCCDGVNSTYHITVGRSKTPLGEYIDKEGKSMSKGGGTTILTSNERWKGTGHNGIFKYKNKDYIILAAYDKTQPEKGRLTQIRELNWDKENFPITGEVINTPIEITE